MPLKFRFKKNNNEIIGMKSFFVSGDWAKAFSLAGIFWFLTIFIFYFSSWSEAAMQSDSYEVRADSINFYGDAHSSDSYFINDTGGEVATGDSSSDNYLNRAGYQVMVSEYRIALNCPATVNMGTIIGTGKSSLGSNEASCTVVTDSPIGYSLIFDSDTDYLENSTADKINSYTPLNFGTPEYWDVDPSSSEWGARLKKNGSTTYNSSRWGTASLSEDYNNADVYWHSVSNDGGFTVVSRPNETALTGDTEIIQFGAEVGAEKIQPTGTYDTDVMITVISF